MNTRSGRLGEQCVESWLEQLGWVCCQRNLRIPGGEIDRLFVRESASHQRQMDMCIAEIKTTHLRSLKQCHELFAEAKMHSLVRPHQLRNLWRTAAYYEKILRQQKRISEVRTYVRYFLVVKGARRLIKVVQTDVRSRGNHLPIKLCLAGQDELILSWSPDVPAQSLG